MFFRFVSLLVFLIFCNSSFSQSIKTIDQIIGKTTIGVTGGGAVWAMYLNPKGYAKFLYSDRTTAEAIWRRSDSGTICFTVYGQSNENCKYVEPAGRGLHWWTVGDSKPSSQLLTVIEAGKWQSPIRVSTVRGLIGTRLFGRIKKDKELWWVEFKFDGTFLFSRASKDEIESGSYEIYGSEICLKFDNLQEAHCRQPFYDKKRLVWSELSDIVYIESSPIIAQESSQWINSPKIIQDRTVTCNSAKRTSVQKACSNIWLN